MAKDGNRNHDKQVVEEVDYEQFVCCISPLCSDISADSKLEAAAAALAIKKLANAPPSDRHRRHRHQTEAAEKMDDPDEAESSFRLVPEADPSDENKVAEVLVKLDQLDRDQRVQDQAEPDGEKITVGVNDIEEEPIDIVQSGETNQEEAAKLPKRGRPRTKNTTELIKTSSSGGRRGFKGRRKYQRPSWLPAQWQVQHITRQTGESAGHVDAVLYN